MENRPVRSTISLLRTVLHLLEDDPAIRLDSHAAGEFRRATLELIAEIEAEHPQENALVSQGGARMFHQP